MLPLKSQTDSPPVEYQVAKWAGMSLIRGGPGAGSVRSFRQGQGQVSVRATGAELGGAAPSSTMPKSRAQKNLALIRPVSRLLSVVGTGSSPPLCLHPGKEHGGAHDS